MPLIKTHIVQFENNLTIRNGLYLIFQEEDESWKILVKKKVLQPQEKGKIVQYTVEQKTNPAKRAQTKEFQYGRGREELLRFTLLKKVSGLLVLSWREADVFASQ